MYITWGNFLDLDCVPHCNMYIVISWHWGCYFESVIHLTKISTTKTCWTCALTVKVDQNISIKSYWVTAWWYVIIPTQPALTSCPCLTSYTTSQTQNCKAPSTWIRLETFARGTQFQQGSWGRPGASNSPSASQVFWRADISRERGCGNAIPLLSFLIL